jgi:hypothetical protein
MEITLTRTKQKKNPNTKTTYFNGDTTTEQITEREYNLLTNEDTIKAFRRGGGKEHAIRCYTCRGYNIVKLTSTSPSGETKIIREFKFK